jgi:hypothetical protein
MMQLGRTHAGRSTLWPGLVVALLLGTACGGGQKPAPGGSGDDIPIGWQATQGEDERVNVSLVVAGQSHAVGTLDAAADDAPGTPATCSIAETTPTTSRFTCGGTPAYNYLVAEVEGGELVVTRVSGIDPAMESDEPERRDEVKRVAVTGKTLTTAPYTP